MAVAFLLPGCNGSGDSGLPSPQGPGGARPDLGVNASLQGDRHILVIDQDHRRLYDLFASYPSGSGYTAGSGAIFDMGSNALRPAGWTSADAAGLPIFPGLVRYDTYGMILADNGGSWFVSGAPDSRRNDEELNTLKRRKGDDFEVVKMGLLTTR